jgi:hypothetical protein
MPNEVIKIGESFACTLGLAAFVGVPGKTGGHAHWTHQIAIDLDGGEISCFCDGQWFTSQGVFVPSGHVHSVQPGRQINLFFDKSINWIDEIFGGELDTTCARVLDRDTLQGIQSCFFHETDIITGVSLFADAFDVRSQTSQNTVEHSKWEAVLSEVKILKETAEPVEQDTYSRLGSLFAL